jgi:unspecific monooxygenase
VIDLEPVPMFVPAKPFIPEKPLNFRPLLRALRTNALSTWPVDVYEQPFVRRSLAGRINYILNEPDAIHRVLVDNPGNYRRSPASVRILKPITGKGLLLAEGDDWKLQRRTVAPALAPRMMPLLTQHMVATTTEALDTLQGQIGEPRDLLELMQNLTLEIAGRSMFSLEVARFGGEMRAMLNEFAIHHARPSMLDLLLPPAIPTLGDLRRRRFQKRWMRLIEAIMHDRLATPPPEAPRDLFDLLRAACDPDTGAGFSAEQLRDQVATLILAGHETTAVTLFWALTLLAQDKVEQDRLADDPDTRTRMVLNETLRLFPAAFLIVREAIGADQAGQHKIGRNDLIMIAPWILHRHHALWQNPDAFDPDRFSPDAPPPPRFSYMPFGTGPRVCVGAQFALAEATIVLSAFIKRFEISMEGDRPVLPVGIVTTQPDHHPLFRLKARAGTG